ncbi:hypothetical protein FQA39_LY07242 [Lamprigera yunnana]|nr:hypothetical protein FQA39_LY07242 [Lamprigera yunnana]
MVNSDSSHSLENLHSNLSAQHVLSKEAGGLGTSSNCNLNDGEGTECELLPSALNKKNVRCQIQTRSMNSTLKPMQLISNIKNERDNQLHRKMMKTILDEVNMDITEPLAPNRTDSDCLKNKSTVKEYLTEFTKVVKNPNPDATIMDDRTMEFTCEIPFANVKTYEIQQTNISCENMELTQGISSNILISNKNNFTILADVSMEQTLAANRYKNNILHQSEHKQDLTNTLIEKTSSVYLNDINSKNFTILTEVPMEETLVMTRHENIFNTSESKPQLRNESIKEQSNVNLNKAERMPPACHQNLSRNLIDVPIKETLAIARDTFFLHRSDSKLKLPNDTQDCIKGIYDEQESITPNIMEKPPMQFIQSIKIETHNLPFTLQIEKKEDAYTQEDVSSKSLNMKNNLKFRNADTVECLVGLAVEKNTETSERSLMSNSFIDTNNKNSCLQLSPNLKASKHAVMLSDETIGNIKLNDDEELPRSKYSSTNFSGLSFCTDDTQHLINYNLSNHKLKSDFSKIITGDLNPSFVNSKILTLSGFSSDVFPMCLENSQDKKNCKSSTHINVGTSCDNKIESGVTAPSSQNIILNISKLNVNDSKEDVPHISQEKISFSELLSSNSLSLTGRSAQDVDDTLNVAKEKSDFLQKSEIWKTYMKNNEIVENTFAGFKSRIDHNLKRIKKEIVVLEKRNIDEVQSLRLFFKNCEMKEPNANLEVTGSSSLSESTEKASDNMVSFEINFTLTSEKILSAEELINNKCKRNKNYWKITLLKETLCVLNVLHNTLQLGIHFEKESGMVSKLYVNSTISDNVEPTFMLLHLYLKERLSDQNIQSAVGEKFDVLTLLDYLHINFHKVLDFCEEFYYFMLRYNFKMDKTFCGKFYIINLLNTWCVSVNMSHLDDIFKSSIIVTAEIGIINEAKIKKCMDNETKGLPFLKKILNDLESYANKLMSQRSMK